jgi:hypothetical protein
MATFAVTLRACVHVPDNTRLIATYLEKYSVADRNPEGIFLPIWR